MSDYLFPRPILPGDTLAVVAPASSPTPEALDAGIASLESAGYQTKTYRSLTQPVGYLSGSDAERAAELMQAFQDPEVSGVVAARGGFGVVRMLNRLDFALVRRNPKALLGYSDITALHAAINKHARLMTFHGPNLVDGLCGGGRLDQLSLDALWRALSLAFQGEELLPANLNINLRTVTGGTGFGRLLGGNLAVLCGLIGAPFEPDFNGRILFLEDVGEQVYRLDRLFSQMSLSGKLSQVSGVILGDFTDYEATDGQPNLSLESVIDRHFGNLPIPIIAGFPLGHSLPNITLPHGAPVTIDADALQLRCEE